MSISINLKSLTRSGRVNKLFQHAKYTSSTMPSIFSYEKDPAASFFHPETQKLLKSMTRLELEKVFRRRATSNNTVAFKFMTDKQLEDVVRKKFDEAQFLLQMPPVMKVMEEKQNIIATDPAMTGFADSSFIFTDVTFGLKNSDRSIVIRSPDGVLQDAPFDVRKRCYQIYFPMQGRTFREPKLFEPSNLLRLIEAGEYEFLLDRTCMQYEPFEPKFHQITSQVYQHVNENQQFDKLRSTRHFGPMAFFFAWHKSIDNLLLDMVRNDFLENAVELICLMFKLNEIKADTSILKTLGARNNVEKQIQFVLASMLSQDKAATKKIEKTAEELRIDELCFEFIQDSFVKSHSLKKGQLELALQTYKERHNELKNIAEGVN